MDTEQIHSLLEHLNQRLLKLDQLVVQISDELRTKPEFAEKGIYLETLEGTVLRLVRQWRDAVQRALDGTSSYSNASSEEFRRLDFSLGHARGLGRDFDMDTSWSKWDEHLRRLISDVSMTALATRSLLRNEEVPALARVIYNDNIDL